MQSFKQVWSVVAKKLTYNVNFAALLLLQKAPKNNYLYVSIYRVFVPVPCLPRFTVRYRVPYRDLPITVYRLSMVQCDYDSDGKRQ